MYQNIAFRSACKLTLVLLLLLWSGPGPFLVAQAQEESGEIAAPELTRSRMSLTATQIQMDSIDLQALLRAKFETVYEKIPYAEIEFVTIGQEDESSLGKVVTDANGIARMRLKKSAFPINEEGYMTMSARFAGNDELEASDSDISIRPGSLHIVQIKNDSSFALEVNAIAASEEGVNPLAEAVVSILVQRMVGMLKVGEGTTDDSGSTEIEFPTDLTGDDDGNIHITAFVEDFEEYGNLSASVLMPWGKPVSSKSVDLPRALWSPYPPTWLFITFLAFLAIIWGHYVHVVIGLFQVHRAAKAE